MTTLAIAPGLYAWTLTLQDGTTRNVLASNMASAVTGVWSSPVVTATRRDSIDLPELTPPVLSTLTPSTAALGSANFTLHVHGTGFRVDDTILWNGGKEPTTFVSATELTTGVNMATAGVAVPIPVAVENIAGRVSNALTFTLTAVD